MAVHFRWLPLLLLLTTLPLAMPLWAKPLQYHLKGLDSELEKNVEAYLDALPPAEPDRLRMMEPNIRKAVSDGLMALGYYSPSLALSINPEKENRITIEVTPGNPVTLRTINIQLTGDAQHDKAFKKLIKSLPWQEGDVLNHNTYESVKSEMTDLALSRGYFDAKMSEHSIKVYPAQRAADIDIHLDSGVRYRFGDIRYGSMTPATQRLLNQMVNFKTGKPYKAIKLSKLNRDFSLTGYFNQIDIRPLRDQAVNHHVPIHIGVSPKTAHELETGVGFSTDEGPRVSLSWNKPWFNEKGHSISNDFKISQVNTELTSRYTIPAGNPLREYYTLEGGYQQTRLDDTDSELLSGSVHRWVKRPESWDRDVFFRVEYEDYIQADKSGSSLLLIPGVAFNRREVKGRDGLDPKSGQVHNLKMELSSTSWGSDTSFIKLWGRSKWLTTLADKHRFIGRIEQGAIQVESVNKLPPSIRFFTGGDQSIRGYSYESISPKDTNNKLTGAKYMTVTSIEYNYEFVEKWRLATFLDAGTATNDYKDPWKLGAGLGIRWVTPVGPLKLDLAWAISEPGTPWLIHFSMGPDL